MARTRIFTQDFSCVRNECRYFTNFILPLRANFFVLKYWREINVAIKRVLSWRCAPIFYCFLAGNNRRYFTNFILTLRANFFYFFWREMSSLFHEFYPCITHFSTKCPNCFWVEVKLVKWQRSFSIWHKSHPCCNSLRPDEARHCFLLGKNSLNDNCY